jgi:N-acetylneuraminic acid mutarotase
MPNQFDCRWQKVALEKGQAPTERSSHGISIISGTLYLFGGEHTARVPIDADVYSIDLSDKKLMSSPPIWRKIEASGKSPIPRIAHAQATIDNKIYIFGGRQGIQMEESPLNDLHYFDVTNETWTEILSEGDNSPSHRSFHQMISVGSSLFIFGGCGDIGRMSDLYEFNTTNSRWTKHSNVIYKFTIQLKYKITL